MREVTRYDLCEFESGVIARENAFLVKTSDYDAIKAERDALLDAMNEIVRHAPMHDKAFEIATLVIGELSASGAGATCKSCQGEEG